MTQRRAGLRRASARSGRVRTISCCMRAARGVRSACSRRPPRPYTYMHTHTHTHIHVWIPKLVQLCVYIVWDLDLRSIPLDFYLGACQKWFGPRGGLLPTWLEPRVWRAVSGANGLEPKRRNPVAPKLLKQQTRARAQISQPVQAHLAWAKRLRDLSSRTGLSQNGAAQSDQNGLSQK